MNSAIIAEFVTPKSWASCSLAGAIMEDETGLMKVNAETMTVAAHLRENFQLQSEGTGRLRP